MADSPKAPYGDVEYADPGYQSDKQKRYPIDTAEHVRAAWSYINQSDNAGKYSAEHLASIKSKIRAAAKKFNVEIAEEEQERSQLPSIDFCSRAYAGLNVVEGADSAAPTLSGYLAVFDEWAEVRSRVEGHFMERFSPVAFTRSLQRDRPRMRLLYNHGEDPQIGFKPIGTIDDIGADKKGVYYRSTLYQTPNVREIIPALEDGQMGSSVTFRPNTAKDLIDYAPKRSDFNPDRLPEVTRQEVRILEFGPCMFPVYQGATAELRSFTDQFVLARFGFTPEQIAAILESPGSLTLPTETALSTARPEVSRSHGETREKPVVPVRSRFQTREGYLEWLRNATSTSSAR